jgi:hypothetical protein
MSYAGIAVVNSKDFAESHIHQAVLWGHPVACAHSRPCPIGHRNKSTLFVAVAQKDRYQYGKEDEKGWLFEKVLVASFLPSLSKFSGQESLQGICTIREGTPL